MKSYLSVRKKMTTEEKKIQRKIGKKKKKEKKEGVRSKGSIKGKVNRDSRDGGGKRVREEVW